MANNLKYYSTLTAEQLFFYNIRGYRKCEDNGGAYFAAVFESSDIDAFNVRIKSEYHNVVSAMSKLIERFVSDDKV